MPSIMLRNRDDGKLLFYIAKKDLEETVESIEFDTPEKWGGQVILGDGSCYYFEPIEPAPKIPITLRAKRV